MSNPYLDYSKGVFTKPLPPPECQTDAEKTAFAFGWWKALEAHRLEQRTWVDATTWRGLTDEEMNDIWSDQKRTGESITRAIEAKLKAKNFAEEKNQ
jgi:hypothetical protein